MQLTITKQNSTPRHQSTAFVTIYNMQAEVDLPKWPLVQCCHRVIRQSNSSMHNFSCVIHCKGMQFYSLFSFVFTLPCIDSYHKMHFLKCDSWKKLNGATSFIDSTQHMWNNITSYRTKSYNFGVPLSEGVFVLQLWWKVFEIMIKSDLTVEHLSASCNTRS